MRFFCADLNGEGIDGGSMCVYFREDADRFIVTDLGEAVHALRLRTGITYDEALAILENAVGYEGDAFKKGADIMEIPKAADLPSAICRVMLAAYEVSRL